MIRWNGNIERICLVNGFIAPLWTQDTIKTNLESHDYSSLIGKVDGIVLILPSMSPFCVGPRLSSGHSRSPPSRPNKSLETISLI